MADTRCAHADYALDVDEMMLEYFLYNATKEHLHDFRSCGAGANGSRSASMENAATLLQVFDQFLELFKLNHPRYELSPDTGFSIKLLQFVVLFTHRRSPEALSSSSRARIRQSSRQNSTIRAQWWDKHRRSEKHGVKEEGILESWHDLLPVLTCAQSGQKTAVSSSQDVQANISIFLLELLPAFLDLSANMATSLGQDVTAKWMVLAAEFMLQSAWEKYVDRDTETKEDPLKSAFGWGRWDGAEELEKALLSADASLDVQAAELRINTMFTRSEESVDDVVVRQEIPEWTGIRLDYLSAFGTPAKGSEGSKQMQSWQVERLKEMAERFPLTAFDGKVIDYLEGLWELGRKPSLVQIEQGQVDGLAKEEFEEFMGNVFPQGSGTREIGQGGRWWS